MKISLLMCGLLLISIQSLHAVPYSSEFDPVFWETQCQDAEDWYCGFIVHSDSNGFHGKTDRLLCIRKHSGDDDFQSSPFKFSNYRYRYYTPESALNASRTNCLPRSVDSKPSESDDRDHNGSGAAEPDIETDAAPEDGTGEVEDERKPAHEVKPKKDAPANSEEIERMGFSEADRKPAGKTEPKTVIHRMNIEFSADSAPVKQQGSARVFSVRPVQRKPGRNKAPFRISNDLGYSHAAMGEMLNLGEYEETTLTIKNAVSDVLPKNIVLDAEADQGSLSSEPLRMFRYKVESVPVNIENGGLADALWVVIAFSIEKIFSVFNFFITGFKYLMNPFSFLAMAICSMAILGISRKHRE